MSTGSTAVNQQREGASAGSPSCIPGALLAALARFDRIYVLTLKRSPERQMRMRRLLEGVDFEFVYGIDRNDITLDDLQRKGVIDMALMVAHDLEGHSLSPGMIACSLSHRMLYESIAASSARLVLILEDDVELAAGRLPDLAQAMSELPSDWGLLYLDYREPAAPSPLQRLVQIKHVAQSIAGRFPLSARAVLRRFAAAHSPHLLRAGYFFYTSAYAITPPAARTLLRLQSPVSYAPDHLLAKACTENLVKAFALTDRLFEQYSLREGTRLTI